MHLFTHRYILSIFCALFVLSASAQNFGDWHPIGPVLFPVNKSGQINGIGRITQVKFHPSNPSTMYVTSVWGLWKSTDTSNTWQLLGTDDFPKATCASVCIDYTNDQVMYLGTGDPNYYSNALGVYKTTDGGQSWLPANSSIGNRMAVELLMSPTNHNVLVAATSDGIWKTTNGGTSWTQKWTGGKFTDMVFKAVPNSTTLFAVTMDGVMIRSTDMGDTWSQVTLGPLPAQGAKGTRLAVSAADSNRVYVSMVGSNTDSTGGMVFRSTDGGNSFTVVKGDVVPNLNGYSRNSTGQGNYNYAMTADPTNANTVYVVGHIIWKSTDGGVNWTQMEPGWWAVIHTDMHGIKVDPYNTNKLFNINDGGIWLSQDGGTTWDPKCSGLMTSEVYHASNSDIRRDLISIGTQDNGELYYNYAGWFTNRGGDWGSRSAFDYIANNNRVYYYSNGNRRLVTGSESSYKPPVIASNNIQLAFTPLATSTAFIADTGLWRTTNLTATSPAWTQLVTAKEKINALCVNRTNANVVYYVTTNQKVYYSINAVSASPSFTALTAPAATNVAASITTVSSDSNIVYLSCGSRVFRSGDKGSTWTNISGSLPQVNIIRLLEDPYASNESIYLATARGVYYRNKNMTDWGLYSIGLPTIADITDMFAYNNSNADSSELRVSFYGRGVFGTKFNNQLVPLISFDATTLNTVAKGTGMPAGCKPYTDYQLHLGIDAAPSGNAKVQLSIGSTSSAIRGQDYDITTNGNFTTPSDSVVFASGATNSFPVTIRVYGTPTDPARKSFIVTFSVSGNTTAMANPAAQTAQVNILYPNGAPVGDSGVINLIAGNGTTAGSASSPFNGTQSDKRAQTIYPGDSLAAAGLRKGYINSFSYNILSRSVTTTSSFQNFNMAIGTTPQTGFTQTAFDTSLTTNVYSGTYTVSDTGWVKLPFAQPYYWDGYSNLLVQSCYDNADGTNQGDNTVASVSISDYNPTTFQRQTNGAGCTFNTASYGSTRPNLLISTQPVTTPVAAASGITSTQYLGPNATVYYYDTSGRVLARLQNLTAFDYGCTSVQIDRSGTGTLPFWNDSVANYLAAKTFKIHPANNNSSGRLNLTLYYSKAEKQGWEAATGRRWDSIQLVRTKGSVSEITPQQPCPGGDSTAVTTGRDSSGVRGTTIYYASATFTNASGGFGVGIPGKSNACASSGKRLSVKVYPTLVRRGQLVYIVPSRQDIMLLVRLYSADGRLVRATRLQGSGTLSTQHLGPGMYFYIIQSGRQVAEGRIVVIP